MMQISWIQMLRLRSGLNDSSGTQATIGKLLLFLEQMLRVRMKSVEANWAEELTEEPDKFESEVLQPF